MSGERTMRRMSQESGGRRRPERWDLGVSRNSVREALKALATPELTVRRHRDIVAALRARDVEARAAQASRGVG